MKNPLIISTAALLLALVCAASAQTGYEDLHEGTHFEVAFGYVWNQSTEKPLPDPFQILITPAGDGFVTLRYGPPGARVTLTRAYERLKTLRIPIPPDAVRHTDLGAIESKSVTVTSTSPISVCTWIGWQGNGNQTLHYPVAAWDTSYWAFSFPQDRFGADRVDYRPGQMAIVATEDNTVVDIVSPAWIASGPSIPSVIDRKQPLNVVLNAHEVLTLAANIYPDDDHSASTDLSGTRIRASKPIAVISGHTKGAVGVYYRLLPTSGIFSAPAHFIRNCFTQSMLPNNLADTAFITIPLLYTAIRVYAAQDTAQRSGDVIRVLATENNTEVRRTRADGSGYTLLAILDAGEYFTALNVTEAHKWSTTKPALVMQYGTSYAKLLPPGEVIGEVESKVEGTQGQPTVVAGMPTMLVVPGVSRWVSSASYYAPEGMDNFLNITFRTSDLPKIDFDSHGLNSFSGSMRLIGGTDLAYIRTAVGTGIHWIGTKPGAGTLMAWNYGSLDGLQQGRAYGHPVAVNLHRTCESTIAVAVVKDTTHAFVSAIVDTTCSTMLYYEVVVVTNVRVDSAMQTAPSISLFLSLVDANVNGSISVRFVTTGGQWVERTIEFIRQAVGVSEGQGFDERHSLSLSVSPQPANDMVSITYHKGLQWGSLRGLESSGTLRVFDYTGTLVMDLSDKLDGEWGTVLVNTHALSRGMYVLHLSNGLQTYVGRLLVE